MTAKTANPSKAIKQQVQKAADFWQRPMFHDRIFIGFVITCFGLSAAVITILIIKVRPQSFVVPLQYSTLRGFDALGPWYHAYTYGLFSLIVTGGNTALAVMSYPKSRITSFFLILGTLVINVFTLVVILTLAHHLNI